MVGSFHVTHQNQNGVRVVQVSGEIDLHTCPQLHQEIQSILQENVKDLVLDLGSVQYIDSTGLGVVAQSAKAIDQEGGKLAVVCDKPQVRKVFELSGLDKKVAMFEEAAAAVGSMGG